MFCNWDEYNLNRITSINWRASLVPAVLDKYPTTSVLTATILIYAIGAGVTAAAGTRLALHLILEKRFMFRSSQLQDTNVLY